jgi:hypothetical protein
LGQVSPWFSCRSLPASCGRSSSGSGSPSRNRGVARVRRGAVRSRHEAPWQVLAALPPAGVALVLPRARFKPACAAMSSSENSPLKRSKDTVATALYAFFRSCSGRLSIVVWRGLLTLVGAVRASFLSALRHPPHFTGITVGVAMTLHIESVFRGTFCATADSAQKFLHRKSRSCCAPALVVGGTVLQPMNLP